MSAQASGKTDGDLLEFVKQNLDKKPGTSRADLARLLNVNQSQITRLLAGARRIRLDEVPKIKKFFGMIEEPSQSELTEPAQRAELGDDRLAPREWSRDVPVYGSASCGPDGLFEFNTGEVGDFVRRPPRLIGVPNIFALYVVGESMFPWRKPGQLVYVHPGLPVRVEDFVVVELWQKDLRGHSAELPDAYVKQLVRMNSETITLKQFKPDKEITLKRKQVKHIYRVVDWDELLGI